MRIVFCCLIFSLLFACSGGENKNRKTDQSFNKEIADRIKLLNKAGVQADSLKIDPNEVDSIVNSLILFSKDIENIGPSISRANRYFDTLVNNYKLSAYDFVKVKQGMHVDDIGSILKQNELTFFNLILLKNNKSDLLLHTAE